MKSIASVLAYKNVASFNKKREIALNAYEMFSQELEDYQKYGAPNTRVKEAIDCMRLVIPAYPDSVNKRRKQCIQLAINALDRTVKCTADCVCTNLAICPTCLANWRYKIAKIIQEVGRRTDLYRLVYRREHYFYPRAVFINTQSDQLEPMCNASFNPVYSLPDAHAPFTPTHESMGGIAEYMRLKNDEYIDVDDYDQMFYYLWYSIGGPGLFAELIGSKRKYLLEMPEEKALELKRIVTEKMKQQSKTCFVTAETRWSAYTPLALELECRRRFLNKQIRDQPGSLQRVTVEPVVNTNTMLRVRLDSLFIMTQRCYKSLKEKSIAESDDLWINQRYASYKTIDGKEGGIWSYLKKVNCRSYKISDKVVESLKIVEKAFPFTGDRLAKCIPVEIPLILGMLRNMHSTKTNGCFIEANRWT